MPTASNDQRDGIDNATRAWEEMIDGRDEEIKRLESDLLAARMTLANLELDLSIAKNVAVDEFQLRQEAEAQCAAMRGALIKAKPIVGAAVAASSNAARPLRQRVYDLIEVVLSGRWVGCP